MSKCTLGYVLRIDTDLNPGQPRFKYREASYTRTINSRGDKIKSKMLLFPVDYEDVKENTDILKNSDLILVCEPFFVDDELRERVTHWVDWANNADPSEYDPFYSAAKGR